MTVLVLYALVLMSILAALQIARFISSRIEVMETKNTVALILICSLSAAALTERMLPVSRAQGNA